MEEMTTISLSEYRRLVEDSLKLQRIKEVEQNKTNLPSKSTVDNEELIQCLKYGKLGKTYSEDVRKFCIALHFYSPRGYEYVRSVFNNHLPATSTMRAWSSAVDGAPGISEEALTVLKSKATEYAANRKELLLALIADEMAIKKKIEWQNHKNDFTGVVTVENIGTNAPVSTAKDVWVFLVVGDDFKLPVAYYLTNGLRSQERAALTQIVMRRINECGAKVTSITMDAAPTNIAMVKELGVDFANNKPFFPSSTEPSYNVYFILDPPHMCKLSRNCFGHNEMFYNSRPIHWRFIEELHKIQQSKNINLSNKLSSLHIQFDRKPMNVRIACETMSNSVANAIDQLRQDGYTEFQDSQASTEFIRYINNIFDISNSKPTDFDKVAFKKPISASNAQETFLYFDRAQDYIRGLEIAERNKAMNKPAITSNMSKAFFGQFHNLTAFKLLYYDYVVNGPWDSLSTFRFSQDHLQTWFSTVRSRLGNCL